MYALLLQLQATCMTIIAAISRRRGTGTGGGGGGGQPVPPYLASTSLAGDSSVIATHQSSQYILTQLDQFNQLFAGSPGPFTYLSSNPSVGTFGSNAIFSALVAGVTNLTVQTQNSLGQTITSSPPLTVTVVAQVATSPIAVTPSSDSVAVAGTKQFTGVVSDQGTPPNVIAGASIAWSSNSANATINSGTGLATGVTNTVGTPVVITATSGAATGTATLAVTASSTVTAVSAFYANAAKGTNIIGPCLFYGGTSPALIAQDQSGNMLATGGVGGWTSSDASASIDANTGVITVNTLGAPTFTYTHSATGLKGTITATVFPTVTWLKQEPVPYLLDSDLRANIGSSVTTGNHSPPGTGGSGALYQDGLNESAVTLDFTRLFQGNQTLLMTLQTGSIPILRTGAFAGQTRIWTICVKRYDNGFNTGASGSVPPAFSYKDGPYLGQLGPSGRSGHLYSNATGVESECNILSSGSEVGGSSETTVGSVTNEWTSQQWIIDLQLYEIRSSRIMSQRLWRCLVGENPGVTNRFSNQQVEGAVQSGFNPLVMNYISAFGENFNRPIVGNIYKSIAFWGVVSGTAFGDPFGVLGTQATPTLTGISGGSIQPGATSQTITLTGTNFNANCYPVFSNSGIIAHYTGDKVSNLTVTPTQITYLVDCTASVADIGNVVVYNAASQVSTAPQTVNIGTLVAPGAPTASNATVVNNQTLTFPVTLNASGSLPTVLAWQYSTDNVTFTNGTDLPLTSPTLGQVVQQQVVLQSPSTLYYVKFAEKNSAGTSATSATVTGTTGAAATLDTVGLVVDWNADLGLDFTTNGAAIGSIMDQIGSATLFQGTAGKKPTLQTNYYGTHNALLFVAANSQSLTANSIISALNSADGTLIILGSNLIANQVNDGRFFVNLDGTNKQGYLVKMTRTTNTAVVQWGAGTSFPILTFSTTMTPASGLHCMAVVFDHTTPAELLAYDGASVTGGSSAYVNPTANPPFVSIGSTAGSSNFGDIGFTRLLWYTVKKTPAQLAAIYSALKTQGYPLP